MDPIVLQKFIEKIDPNHLFYCAVLLIMFVLAFPRMEPILKLLIEGLNKCIEYIMQAFNKYLEHKQRLQDKKFEREDRVSSALMQNSETLSVAINILNDFKQNCLIHQQKIKNKLDSFLYTNNISKENSDLIELKKEIDTPPIIEIK